MASTREERQQMRQRGAATRKTKEVDFGFSFGGPTGPTIGFPEPTKPAIISEPTGPSQTSAATTTTPSSQKVSSHPESQTGNSQRTPGSSRNHLPQRPSAYDIPPDHVPEPSRSNKRRKINPPGTENEANSQKLTATASNIGPPLLANAPETQAGHATASTTEAPQQDAAKNAPESPSAPTHETHIPGETEDHGESTINGENAEVPAVEEQPEQPMDTIPDRIRSSKSRSPQVAIQLQPKKQPPRKSRTVESPTQPDQETAEVQSKQPSRKSKSPPSKRTRKPEANAQEKPSDDIEAPEASPTSTTEHNVEPDTSAVAVSDKQTRRKAARGANSSVREEGTQPNGDHSIPPSTEEAAPNNAPEGDQNGQPQVQNPMKAKRSRRRPSPTDHDTHPQPESLSQGQEDPIPTVGESSTTGARRTRQPTKKQKNQPGPDADREVDEEPEVESAQPKPRPGKKGKAAKRALEQLPEPEPQEEEASQEPARATEAESSKQRRGQAGKKAKRATRGEASPTQEQPETQTETSQPAQRKPREPRGETVPVTIHRLANASALGAPNTSVTNPEEEGDGPHEDSSTNQKDKLPNRGGVNPADVLSQICRETLEKTLTTLKTGIENETNAARRAEWSRKRKAVETFGMELDGRLLDLSEMLDSNFVLGVQLKKAKREMLDLRSHLHKVRRERESIALQMDQVRSKHMEKENEKTTRSTINNSIHSLELALDRSQYRGSPSMEPSSTELEFLLRSVAEEVSCRAPGAQGGLLHQIQSFNAQLESTARQLERS